MPGVFSPVLWKIDTKVSYALEGMADVSGAAIQWLRDGLGIIEEYSQAEALAATVSDNGGAIYSAFIGGLDHRILIPMLEEQCLALPVAVLKGSHC